MTREREMEPPLNLTQQPPAADDKPLVLLADPMIPEFEPDLSARFRLVSLASASASAAATARALLTVDLPAVTADVLAALPSLELVVASSVGVDHVDRAACRRRGIRVTNAAGAFSADAADYAVGLVLAVLRRVAAADAYVRRGGWPVRGEFPLATKAVPCAFMRTAICEQFPLIALFCFPQVSGKRVGIVGLGRIGTLVARRLSAFGCPISYHSRSPKPPSPAAPDYTFFPTVRELASHSDVLVLTCTLTDATRHSVGREVMEALGPRGALVNVGRGGLVDEPELVRCLRDGLLGGAGLDVFENEPHVPPELLDMDNVVLSNHRAVLTPESIRGVLDVVVHNLDAFFDGRPLLSPVGL